MQHFREWCVTNYINVEFIHKNVFAVIDGADPKSASFYLYIAPIEKQVSKDLVLQISDDDKLLLSKYSGIKEIVYCWGGRYYVEKIADSIHLSFCNFLYVGVPNVKYKKPAWSYSHLGIHTHFELLNGTQSIKPYIEKALFHQEEAIGICDYNTLAGALDLQIRAKKAGLKPIIGMSVSVLPYVTATPFICKLYVKNYDGWRNLLRINKVVNVDSDEHYIEISDFIKYGGGLICVIDKHKFSYPLEYAKQIKDSFDFTYYQLDSTRYNDAETQLAYLNGLQYNIDLFASINIQPILIDDVYYTEQHSHELKNDLNKLRKKHFEDSSENQHFKSLDEIFSYWRSYDNKQGKDYAAFIRAALDNVNTLVGTCDFQIPLSENKLPVFKYDGPNETYKNKNNRELFETIIFEGFKRKCPDLTAEKKNEYIERIKKEYAVIKRTGFIDYFLITWDIINYARCVGIRPGIGRGSVGGSLIAYLIDLTDIDPVHYDLLFERFLNVPDNLTDDEYKQIPYPDIDCDFAKSGKDDIKKYICERYGYDQVCSIGTYTSLRGKGAFTALVKADGYSYQDIKYMTSFLQKEEIEDNWKDLFISAIEKETVCPQLTAIFREKPALINKIKDIFGTNITKSVHPSAVLIVPQYNDAGERMTVYDWLPVSKIDGNLVSQWMGTDTEKARFLKEDILGLRQLDKFDEILVRIKENQGVDILLSDIPMDDKGVYQMFAKGLNEDIFQFNQFGMKKYCQLVKPDNIEDLIAMNALYRPGPMKMKTNIKFAEIKHGRLEATYDFGLKEVTKKTYGLYVYQEQIMQAVVVLGGLSLVEADNVRQAIKKHDKNRMDTSKMLFLSGAQKKGCSLVEAESIWENLQAFSGYGFNRSHSAAYSVMSYHAQWFKANYPLEFWTTALNQCDENELFLLIDEVMQDRRIRILPADINKSDAKFTCEYIGADGLIGNIISGFKVKSLGDVASANILEARKQRGVFLHLDDFVRRTAGLKVNKTIVANLILAGCFDEMHNIPYGQEHKRFRVYCDYIKYAGGTIPADMQLTENKGSDLFFQLKQKEATGLGIIDYANLLARKEPNWVSINVNGIDYSEMEPNDKLRLVVTGELDKITVSKDRRGNSYATFTMIANGRVVTGKIFEKNYKTMETTVNELVSKSNKTTILFAAYGVKSRMSGNNTDQSEFMVEKIKLLN